MYNNQRNARRQQKLHQQPNATVAVSRGSKSSITGWTEQRWGHQQQQQQQQQQRQQQQRQPQGNNNNNFKSRNNAVKICIWLQHAPERTPWMIDRMRLQKQWKLQRLLVPEKLQKQQQLRFCSNNILSVEVAHGQQRDSKTVAEGAATSAACSKHRRRKGCSCQCLLIIKNDVEQEKQRQRSAVS